MLKKCLGLIKHPVCKNQLNIFNKTRFLTTKKLEWSVDDDDKKFQDEFIKNKTEAQECIRPGSTTVNNS